MPASVPLDLTKSVNYGALKGRNVVLTGAASGIGLATAKMLAQNGANLVLADINQSAGQKVEEELKATGANVKFVQTDVTSLPSQAALITSSLSFFGREIDIYIPNAGILGPPTQISPADPSALASLTSSPADLAANVITVNLESVYNGVMLVARYGMGLHNGAPATPKAILLMDSLAGYCGAEASVSYTCAKFGVRGLLRGFRKQAAGMGIRLNSVCPFYVETPMTAQAVQALSGAGIPIASVDHIVEAFARLATDDTVYGRAISIMPEGLSDLGDDSKGLQAGEQFSTKGLGEHWAVLINGPLSDEIPA